MISAGAVSRRCARRCGRPSGCCSRRPAPAAAGRSTQPGTLCGACWPKLHFLERPWCPVMGTPFVHDMGEGFLSAEAIANPPPFDRARAAVAYSGVARQMVQAAEIQRPHRAGAVDGALDGAGRRTSSSPMPMWWCRCRCTGGASCARRFNQSAELARAVAKLSRQAFRAARRARASRSPASRSGSACGEREDNVRGAFKVPPRARHHGARPARAGGRRRLHDRRDRFGGGAGAEAERRGRRSTC